jgi:hypothetical protein
MLLASAAIAIITVVTRFGEDADGVKNPPHR